MTDPNTAALARIRQMADHWEQYLPEVIRTPAVVSALRAALESAVPVSLPPADRTAQAPSIPSTADTAPADESPHIYMTAIRHQAAHVHDFTKAGQMTEALEHVEAIERLLAVYRRAVGAQAQNPFTATSKEN